MEYDQYVQRKRIEYGAKFDPSDLAPAFIPYFRNGQRIKIRTAYGEEITGTVGVTTGWRPAFLLMRRSSAIGSSTVLGTRDTIIAVQRGRIYIPIAELSGDDTPMGLGE